MRAPSPDELINLAMDDSFRYAALYRVVDKQGNLVPFRPNEVQRRINECKSKKKLLLKSRQCGVTTGELIKMLDAALWTENFTGCILAHEKDALEKVFLKCRRAYENIPEQFRPRLARGDGSKYELKFASNGSRLYADLESRGDTIQWLHVSEAAFVADPARVLATAQAVPAQGIVTLESTPNGFNWFYDRWQQFDDYTKLFFPWFFDPSCSTPTSEFAFTDEECALIAYAEKEYGVKIDRSQIAWRRSKRAELKGMFIQEYPEDPQSCFLSSGGSAVDLRKVSELLRAAPEPIEESDTLKIYEHKQSGYTYVIGADCAEGQGGDFSVATVFDSASMKQVAVLRGQFQPIQFAHEILALAQRYETKFGMPLLAVERNNHGHSVLLERNEHIGYANLYRAKDEKLGWLTNLVTRPIMFDTLIDGVQDMNVQLSDRTTLQEVLTLVNKGGKIQAESGKHDDCVVASAIAVQLCTGQSGSDYFNNLVSMIRAEPSRLGQVFFGD